MKKVLVIAVLFICQNVFCQEYHFDYFLEYEISLTGSDIFMINSNNQDYVFYCYNNGKNLEGKIVDHKSNIAHHYSIKSVSNNLEFKYLYSEKKVLEKRPEVTEPEKYEVKKATVDSLNQSFEIIEFKNKKKKRVYQSASINMTKIDFKPLPIILYGYFHHFAIGNLIDFPQGYIPSFIQINFSNNRELKIKLIQNKKINIVLSLKPEEIKYN